MAMLDDTTAVRYCDPAHHAHIVGDQQNRQAPVAPQLANEVAEIESAALMIAGRSSAQMLSLAPRHFLVSSPPSWYPAPAAQTQAS